jgi:glycosyltransferase involved in cell wall biosynthesis
MEAGGAVVLEAMASGVPVIATRWGGPADYLDDTTGVLIDAHNPEQFIEDLALAIIRFAREPQLRRRLAVAGYERAVERFDWEKKIDTMLALYTDASGLRASDAVPTATPIGRQIETALLADASR